jgi:hypothetical protein
MKSTKDSIECWVIVKKDNSPLWDRTGDSFYKSKQQIFDTFGKESFKNSFWKPQKIKLTMTLI